MLKKIDSMRHLIRVDSAERKIFGGNAALRQRIVESTFPYIWETYNTNLQHIVQQKSDIYPIDCSKWLLKPHKEGHPGRNIHKKGRIFGLFDCTLM